jgi:broad specificity phosphatase PhoE
VRIVIPLVLIRHGPTEWNAAGRLQGHTDVPLSPAGRRAVRTWRLPEEITETVDDWDWLTSPLSRTRETAEILLPAAARAALRLEPALIEMYWGTWEGRILAEVRRTGGAKVAEEEARGLDFCPPGGESPRQVQDRLAPLLAALAARGRPVAAITHKGVIRAVMARATGWDMTGRAPAKLHHAHAHRFALEPDGTPRLERLNIPLVPSEAAP